MLIGYARVSTIEQNLDLQLDALKNIDCKKLYATLITLPINISKALYFKKRFIRNLRYCEPPRVYTRGFAFAI